MSSDTPPTHEVAPTVFYASSSHGYRRGPARASREEALAHTRGGVLELPLHSLLAESRINWTLVDEVYPGGIEEVLNLAVRADDWGLADKAWAALKMRFRDEV